MQPLAKQVKNGPDIGGCWSTMTRGAVLQLQRARQRDAEQLLRLAVRLDEGRGNDRLAGLGAGILAGEADLLGGGVLTLAAELRPRE